MPEQCNSCRFWLAVPNEPGELLDNATWGWCRRNPPAILDHMARMTIPHLGNGSHNYDPENVAIASNVEAATLFPATSYEQWCGRHKPFNEVLPL